MMASRACRRLLVEEETGDSLADIVPQFVPGFGLREDIFGQALGAVAAVGFLYHLKHQFSHTST